MEMGVDNKKKVINIHKSFCRYIEKFNPVIWQFVLVLNRLMIDHYIGFVWLYLMVYQSLWVI